MHKLFFDPEGEFEDADFSRKKYLFSTQDVVDFINNGINSFYSINDLTLDQYEYYTNRNGSVIHPIAIFVMQDNFSHRLFYKEFNLT